MAAEAWLRNFMRNDGEVVSLKEALRRLDEVRGNGNEKTFRSSAVAYLSIIYLYLSVCLSVCIFTERVSFLSYLILSPPPHTHHTTGDSFT